MTRLEEQAISTSNAATIDMKLEVVVIAVSDVDRAKAFYEGLEWRLDADFPIDENYRVVQFTPPGSPASTRRSAATRRTPPLPSPSRCAVNCRPAKSAPSSTSSPRPSKA